MPHAMAAPGSAADCVPRATGDRRTLHDVTQHERGPLVVNPPLRDRAALEALLHTLPPPAAGHVRVFRGQTSNYPALLPSACRPNAPPIGRLWDIALMTVRHASTASGDASTGMERMMDIAQWFKVLAQHYGPGSPYLDVTRSIDVALWFALNKSQTSDALGEFVVSQPGIGEVCIKCPMLAFAPHTGASGWFYVLDVPRADGTTLPRHGELLDLAAGPDFVSTCRRVVSQHGGLVMGEREVDGGNLARYFACPPIAVARPFGGAGAIDASVREIFPELEEDEWYSRLLQAPLVPHPSAATGFEFRQSLGVYIVTPSGRKEEALPALERQVSRMAPLARGTLRGDPALRRHLRESVGVDPESATYVQLEIPLLSTTPPADWWNQGVLMAGLGARAQPRLESSGELLPAVSIDNVLIEFSPLEAAFLDLDAHPEVRLVTSLWLLRRGQDFRFTVFVHSPASGGHGAVGPVDLAFSETTHRFEVVARDGARVPLLLAGLPAAHVKAVLVGISVLRSLSPACAPDPYPLVATAHDGGIRSVVAVRCAATVLARCKADPSDLRLHFLRYADTLQPYLGPGPELPSVALLTLQSPGRFETLLTLHDVYGHVHHVEEAGRPVRLPPRASDGVSASIADYLLQRFPPQA